jgi:uncharacterized protein YceH (UPF0502 family)
MLRGPQTPGELRARAERMHRFVDLESLEATLQKLAEREPPLVRKLARLPGTKEPRYAHLLAGDQPEWNLAAADSPAAPVLHAQDDRVTHLESEIAQLRQQIAGLQQQFREFKKQFE